MVHWPIYVIAARENYGEKYIHKFSLILISFLCAHLLWKYIEKPFQKIPIPRFFRRDTEVFNYLKSRRPIVNLLILLILGLLYFVSFPSSESSNSNPKKNSSVERSNVKDFAYYESQLISSSPTTELPNAIESSTASSTVIDGNSELNSLIQKNSILLKSSIKDLTLSPAEAGRLIASKNDLTDFENSICSAWTVGIPPPDCVKNTNVSNSKRILIVGDSKMGMFAEVIGQYFEAKNWLVQYDVMNGCHLSDGLSLTQPGTCNIRSNWTLDHLRENKYDLIIFSEYPSPAINPARQNTFFNLLTKSGNKVLLLGTMTRVTESSECLSKTLQLSSQCTIANAKEKAGINWNRQLQSNLQSSNVFYVDSSQWFCVNQNCPLMVNEIFTFRDGVHLTATYVKTLKPIIFATLETVLAR